ncbi:response regulator [Mesobacterium pallidum]|uniref:response regulator n=1 Tax=Mesobacterium pallidum TaxID=2872037 RepID=UPI001EE2762C|nr:response regulator [Mesobacterium pallidum]
MSLEILIVAGAAELGQLWQGHLKRRGAAVDVTGHVAAAAALIEHKGYHVVIIDIQTDDGEVLPLTDLIGFRWPETRVILVTRDGFFSDGSVFGLGANVHAMLSPHVPPDDLVALVEYHGGQPPPRPI